MYRRAFEPIYLRYHDDETDPYLESLASLQKKAQCVGSEYFFCDSDGVRVGMIRVISDYSTKEARISPMCVLPEFQGKGFAQAILIGIEQRFSDIKTWYLDTIAEEPKLLHLYKKVGYQVVAEQHKEIKPGMNLAYFIKYDARA
jgi:GNAT superfamily N-acetyltransferase